MLIGHLAQFSSFFTQGELLCTQGLAYLLRHPDALDAFAEGVIKPAGISESEPLTWQAEPCQPDGGRPDLEGCRANGTPFVKIEAKLGAEFGDGQLTSYVNDLRRHDGGGLLVLVPNHRMNKAIEETARQFSLSGNGPWQLPGAPGIAISVISWEQVLDTLGGINLQSFASDFAQFRAMYRVLSGNDILPITSDAEVLQWRTHIGTWENLVNRVTRQLTANSKVLPLGTDNYSAEYRRRYVGQTVGDHQPHFSIGTRDPFEPEMTPIWLRFHKDTPMFRQIRTRLSASNFSARLKLSSGHIWFPLDAPKNAESEEMIASLVAQVKDIIDVAYGPEPSGAL